MEDVVDVVRALLPTQETAGHDAAAAMRDIAEKLRRLSVPDRWRKLPTISYVFTQSPSAPGEGKARTARNQINVAIAIRAWGEGGRAQR